MVVVALTALLCVAAQYGSALAQPAQPTANPSPADIETAKGAMAAGVAFMQDPDGAKYDDAYVQFRTAYEKSGSLNALHNLAICAQKLELDGEAITYYKRVLDKKGDTLDGGDKQQIQRDLAALKAAVAWVTLSATKSATAVDERTPRSGSVIRNRYKIGTKPLKLGFHPGVHKVKAGGKTWSVEIAPGSTHSHKFDLGGGAAVAPVPTTTPTPTPGVTPDPVPDPDPIGDPGEGDSGSIPVYVWIAGGVTIAAGIAWGVFLGMSTSKKAEYDDEILGQRPIQEQQDAADSLKTTNLLADVFLGVTVAGAATTAVLLILALTGDDSGDEVVSVTPLFDHRGGAGATVTTTF